MHLAVKRSLLQTLFWRPDNGVACSCSEHSVRQDALPLLSFSTPLILYNHATSFA